MKKLLLLDTDVILDLHTLGLFERFSRAYEIQVTREVFDEAKYYKKGGRRFPVRIGDKVRILESVNVESLKEVVTKASQARLEIHIGEATSIACLVKGQEEMIFCGCDKAALKLIAFMNLESGAISLESALKNAGQDAKLYPRHCEVTFKQCIKDGKILFVQMNNWADSG